MRALLLLLSAFAALIVACLPPQEDPTAVIDLRVLGISLEPPEVVLEGCDAPLLLRLVQGADGGLSSADPKLLAELLAAAVRPVAFKALIGDPKGGGRLLDYRLRACANTGDRACDDAGDFVELGSGRASGGTLELTVLPAAQVLDDGQDTPLLLEVLNQDGNKGLGGIRVPLVLELASEDGRERVFAQKLMVYTCQLFPERTANVTPRLPGLLWRGEPWPEGEVRQHSGREEVPLAPVDFSALEESYVVPSFTLERVALEESWKLNWLTTSGTMRAYGTGGTDFAGETGRHQNAWRPDPLATEPAEVRLYVVARDGRGGESWLSRTVRWTP